MSFFSRLFGKAKDDSLKDAMQAIYRLIDDEEHQNSLLPEAVAQVIKGGPACDVVPGSTGIFGFEPSNPIPVNGAIGELAYLSRLETLQGERLLFHRIGAIGKVDVFEAVSYSGSAWYVFFIDMYHPRRSRQPPEGFVLANEPRQFSGFHNFCEEFPYDFVKAKQESPDLLRLAYIPLSHVTSQIESKVFSRPLAHKAKLDIVLSQLSSRLAHGAERSDNVPAPSGSTAPRSAGEELSFDHVMVDLHNKFRGWTGIVEPDDVSTKVLQRQMIYEVARLYVFALFTVRGLIADRAHLRTAKFSRLQSETAARLAAQRIKTAELMFAPLKVPGMTLGADTKQIRAQVEKDIADALASAKASAEGLEGDGSFDDRKLVQLFLSKAPLLTTDQMRTEVARGLSTFTQRFVRQ